MAQLVAPGGRLRQSRKQPAWLLAGAAKVDPVGHSQGGTMPRYYLNFLGGASKVRHPASPRRRDQRSVVTPYTNAFLPGAANVTNITVQSLCVLDGSDHLEIAADPTGPVPTL